MTFYNVTITGPPEEGGEHPTRTFIVDAPHVSAAKERALDEVTGDGEFWPPRVSASPVEPEVLV